MERQEIERMLLRALDVLPDAADLDELARRLPLQEEQAALLRALPLEPEEPSWTPLPEERP